MSLPEGGFAAFDHREFPAALLATNKGSQTISVCIPARDEAATVGSVVARLRAELPPGFVDELVVVDDGSLDDTAEVARRAGARVVSGSVDRAATGKGEALVAALVATRGDLVVFLDADVTSTGGHYVAGLVGPLLARPELVLVKARYARPLGDDPSGGGRVTELVARPALSLLFPELAGIGQPLAGETALRRSALEGLDLAPDYGIEVALLIDVAERFGASAIAEVDLGTRTHRNRSLAELAPQARAVLHEVLERAGIRTR